MITQKSLLNLWNFCKDAHDDFEDQFDEFYQLVSSLIDRGEISSQKVITFLEVNDISNGKDFNKKYQKKLTTRAKTIDNGPIMPAYDVCGRGEIYCGESPHRYTRSNNHKYSEDCGQSRDNYC